MTKEEVQQALGPDYVLKRIVEDEQELFGFFVSRAFEESGGNDRYILLGAGPFYYNKVTGEKRVLGSMEYIEKRDDSKLLQDHIEEMDKVPAPPLDELIQAISARQHVNGDEFEAIMNHTNIDLYRVSIISEDMIHEEISSPESEDIDKFQEVFERAGLSFKRKDSHTIILKNG